MPSNTSNNRNFAPVSGHCLKLWRKTSARRRSRLWKYKSNDVLSGPLHTLYKCYLLQPCIITNLACLSKFYLEEPCNEWWILVRFSWALYTHCFKYSRLAAIDGKDVKIRFDTSCAKRFYVTKMLQLDSLSQLVKKRFFSMSRNYTRSKLMRTIYHLRLWLNSTFLFFDTFLNRQTNLKSMFSPLSVKWRDFRWYAKEKMMSEVQ